MPRDQLLKPYKYEEMEANLADREDHTMLILAYQVQFCIHSVAH